MLTPLVRSDWVTKAGIRLDPVHWEQVLWNVVLCQIAASKPPSEITEKAKELLEEDSALATSE